MASMNLRRAGEKISRDYTQDQDQMTRSLLRSLIHETLLTEEVYGAQAVVYHGTEADPVQFVSALLNDEFRPGEGAGSMYGKGLYTVYDLKGTQTESGNYGPHIIKLKLNLYGYIIFDPEVALRVYKAPLSIVEQAQEVGADEDVIEKLRSVKIARGAFTSVAAEFASAFLKGRVKGIVYTGSNDGRCAVVYDPATAVPIAWKNVRDMSWTPVDRASIKPALRRSASGDWEEEKYEIDPLRLLARLKKLPIDQRIVKGDLDLARTPITSLPAGLRVGGYLNLSNTSIASLPDGLRVGGGLNLSNTSITSLPDGLRVGGSLNLRDSSIASLPASFQVGGDLGLSGTRITSLPDDLKVGGSLDLARTPITSLPDDLSVGVGLDVRNTRIKSLPAGFQVGGSLLLFGAPIKSLPTGLRVGGSLYLSSTIKSLPEDLQVGQRILNFSGAVSLVPAHLRSKLA
jgi:hypothetical protein